MRTNFKTKLALLISLSFLAITINKAQDTEINLTQFNYSPVLLNAANTGNFYGDWRAGLNYRRQWAATGDPYVTAVLSGDKKFKLLGQDIGAGIVFVTDQTGGLGINQNKIYASGSYYYDYGKNHFSAGLQIGLAFNALATTEWNVYNPATGEFDRPSGETNVGSGGMYPDINLGVRWMRIFGRFEPEVGLSLGHLNSPNSSFLESTSKVPLSTRIHASVKTEINDEIYVLPTFLIANSNKNTLSIIGTNVGYKLLGNRSSVKEIFGGVYVRNGLGSELSDFTILVGTTVGRLDVALNYDVNISNFSQSENASTIEISLIYKSLSTVLNSYSIPCERF